MISPFEDIESLADEDFDLMNKQLTSALIESGFSLTDQRLMDALEPCNAKDCFMRLKDLAQKFRIDINIVINAINS